MPEIELRQLKDRHAMIRFFDGYATERMDELQAEKLRRPLVKSHLLEILDGQGHTTESLQAIFGRHGARLSPLDESLFHFATPIGVAIVEAPSESARGEPRTH